MQCVKLLPAAVENMGHSGCMTFVIRENKIVPGWKGSYEFLGIRYEDGQELSTQR